MARATDRTGRSVTLMTLDEPETPAEHEAEAPTGDAAETKTEDEQAEDEQAEDAQEPGRQTEEAPDGALASDEAEAEPQDEPQDEDDPADDDPDSATADLAARGLDPPERGRGFRAGLAVLSVLCVALAVTTVVFGMRWQHDRATDAARNAAVAAARQRALSLTSINFNTADKDVNNVISGATGDFRTMFTQNLSSYVDIVKKNQVITTGQVTAAGVQDINAKTAHIILAVQSDVRNTAAPKGEVRTYRMALQMEHQGDGSWLVSRVDFVP
jgi:Mce-associated membrane protein